MVAGLSMGGALVLRLAADRPGDVAGVVVVNPAVATKRLDVKLLPVSSTWCRRVRGIANDIKKPGGEEHGYTRTPLRAAHSMMQAWPLMVAELPKVTVPLLYLRSTEDHVVDDVSQPIITRRRVLDRRHRRTAQEQLPRPDPRPRRTDHRGVGGVRRSGDIGRLASAALRS